MKRHRTHALLLATAFLGAASLSFERSASAEPSAADKAAAETLFVNARKQMGEGKFVDACKGFAESQRLDPGVGTLLNLGRCYEKLGRTASAWSTYREAAAAARVAKQPAREKNARIAAEALEKQLPMLTISVAGAETAPDFEVRRDGAVVPRTLWGMAVAIDPGEHVFEASAAHSKSWRTRVNAEAGKALKVNVPALEPDGSAAASAKRATPEAPAPVAKKEAPSPEPAASKDDSFGPQRIAAVVVGAAGLGALGVGGYFTYRAKSQYDSVSCDGTLCEAGPYETRRSAIAKANSATFLAIGGLAAIAGGVVLWLTAPTGPSDEAPKVAAPKPRIWVSADPFGETGTRSIAVSGVF